MMMLRSESSRSQVARDCQRARDRSAEHHRHQEEGEHCLDHEACCGVTVTSWAPRARRARARRAEAGGRTAQHGPQQERTEDSANELTDDVAGRLRRACARREAPTVTADSYAPARPRRRRRP